MAESTSQQLVVFSHGSEEYALPIGTVHEIIRYTEPRPLAGRLEVASDGEALRPDTALLAPGGLHLRVGDDRRTALSDAAPDGGLRPRADITIADVARLYGPRVVLAVLTGMGARAVRAAGGRLLAEADETCTIDGMPRAVAEAGLADHVLPLRELAGAIAREVAG